MTQIKPSYFISAGEYSGDLLAADLVKALNEQLANQWQAIGVCGPKLIDEGVVPLVSQTALQTMGFAELLTRLGDLRQVEAYLLNKIDEMKPQFAVLVDYPGFHFRLAEQLHLRGIPVIQYVAPKLWAWGAHRIKRLRRDFDLVLGVLPFEERFFKDHGVSYHYVGSPHYDRMQLIRMNKAAWGYHQEEKLIALLPGSRMSEVQQMAPLLLSLSKNLNQRYPTMQFAMPIAESLSFSDVVSVVKGFGYEVIDHDQHQVRFNFNLTLMRSQSLELLSAADVAVLASGTATLECALARTPMCVVYKMNPLTYEMAKDLVQIQHVSLVNLMAQKEVVREFIQDISMQALIEEVESLLNDSQRRDQMLTEFDQLELLLTPGAAKKAAQLIVEFLHQNK